MDITVKQTDKIFHVKHLFIHVFINVDFSYYCIFFLSLSPSSLHIISILFLIMERISVQELTKELCGTTSRLTIQTWMRN